MATSAKGEAAPGRGMGGDDTRSTGVNLTGQKMKKIHGADSVATNGW
jgi:hypothetical protein